MKEDECQDGDGFDDYRVQKREMEGKVPSQDPDAKYT